MRFVVLDVEISSDDTVGIDPEHKVLADHFAALLRRQ